MPSNKISSCLLIFFILTQTSLAQQEYPADYFVPPLDIPLNLSGSFGELRDNHFHSGIDLRTQGVTGLRVYASAEGYVSRIKIEAAGYGNSIYITHPAGYTTVYGHLDRFREDIQKYTRDLQYKNQQHALNLFPGRDELPVKKGEFIAFSGTSGYSFGPHLHYEIREAARQDPINVLLFGFDIEDIVAPKVFSLYVYPADEDGLVNNSRKKVRFEVEGDNGIYRLREEDSLRLNGLIGFGIEAYDYLNGANNRCGLYSIRMQVDGELKFHWEMEKFSFSETRYINSFIDYEEKGRNNKSVQKVFIDPNNQLGLYRYADQAGMHDFSEKGEHHISFQLEDSYGNLSTFEFTAAGGRLNTLNDKPEQNKFAEEFSCMSPNEFKRNGLEFQIPIGALYRDLKFNYARTERLPGTYSPVYHIHDPYTPLHLDCTLAIEPVGLPDSLREKAIIGQINEEDEIVSVGGEWVDGKVATQIRDMGSFTVIVDTLPPEINPLNLKEDMRSLRSIRFSILDGVSGIKSYEGYIDNEWVLFEYDLKNDLVFYTFDASRISRDSQHELELYITDNKDNISYYYTQFIW